MTDNSKNFNNGSLPKFENHAQLFKATNELATASLDGQAQPSMEEAMEMMFDPQKAQEFVQKQQETLNKMIVDIEGIKKTTKNSDALPEETREAFSTFLLAQQGLIAAQVNMMAQQTAAMSGAASEEDMLQAAMDTQAAQQASMEKKSTLYEALYGFQDGDTFNASALPTNVTIEDVERAEALLSYSSSPESLTGDLGASLQAGDMSALEDLTDLIDESVTQLAGIASAVTASTAMTAEEKTVTKDVITATQSLYGTLSNALSGLASGDMEALQGLQALPEYAKNVTVAQSKYYDVLDQHYQNKAAPTNDNSVQNKAKKGPNAGGNNS